MSLTVLDNEPLRAVGLFPLLDVEANASFPLNLGGTGGVGYGGGGGGEGPYGSDGAVMHADLVAILDEPALRWSTVDLPTTRGQYDAVLMDWPQIVLDNDLGTIAQLTVTLKNADGRFNGWMDARSEYRGKLAQLHFAQIDPTTWRDVDILLDRFTGSLAHLQSGDSPRVVQALFVRDDPKVTRTLIPRRVVTTRTFRYAPALVPATGGLGATLPVGQGIGRNLPCRLVRAPASLDDLPVYDVTPGMGTVAFHAVKLATASGAQAVLVPFLDYVVLPREYRDSGRPVATVRMFRAPQGPITADVEARFPDVRPSMRSLYTWSDGFWDWAGGRHATSTTMTTAQLVTGRGGQGTGAVRFSRPEHVLTLPNVNVAGETRAVREVELFVGEGAPAATIVDFGAITIAEDDGDLTVAITTDTDSDTLTASVPREAYHTIRVELDDGDVTLYVDGDSADTATVTGTPAWTANATVGEAGEAKLFDLGCVLVDTAALGAADAMRTHLRYVKSPVEALRLFAEEAGELSDETTYRTVGLALANAADGYGMQADGWLVNPVPALTAYTLCNVFRDLRAHRNLLGVLEYGAYTEATEVALSVGVGPPLSNALQRYRGRRSEREAIRMLPLHYRQQRGPDGQVLRGNGVLGEYQHETLAFCQAVGLDADPLELPLVDSHRTADVLRDWFAKKLVIEDERLDLTISHEARELARGKLVNVSIDGGDVDTVSYRLAGGAHKVTQVDATLHRYDARLFDYSASEMLPTDPTPSTIAFLDVGSEQDVLLTDADGNITVDIRLSHAREAKAAGLLGIHLGSYHFLVEGAASVMAKLEPGAGYATLEFSTAHSVLDVTMGDLLAPLDNTKPIDRAGFAATVRTGTHEAIEAKLSLLVRGSSGTWTPYAFTPNPTHDSPTAPKDLEVSWDEHPQRLEPWAAADFTDVGARVEVPNTAVVTGETLYLESLRFKVWQAVTPTNLGRVLVWVSTSSALPPETQAGAVDFGPLLTGEVPAGAPGTYYVTARLYDVFGRLGLTLGPTAVVVS
jgi:hypothetical protein